MPRRLIPNTASGLLTLLSFMAIVIVGAVLLAVIQHNAEVSDAKLSAAAVRNCRRIEDAYTAIDAAFRVNLTLTPDLAERKAREIAYNDIRARYLHDLDLDCSPVVKAPPSG